MKPDSYLEELLRKWGRHWFSENLYYPQRCAYLKQYRPKGYKEETADLDAPEVERLAEFMPLHIGTMGIHCLRVRYRQKIRNKRRAAKYMTEKLGLSMSEHRYRQVLNNAYRILNERF
jgi:hypothetical protein